MMQAPNAALGVLLGFIVAHNNAKATWTTSNCSSKNSKNNKA
jgi:hypothetical protein